MKSLVLRILCSCALAATAGAQAPAPSPTDEPARRLGDRLSALRLESERLAGEAGTLVGELRTLEIERDLRRDEARRADAAAAEARLALERMTERLAELESERAAQLPDLQTQLVDIYKNGRGGYARLLFGAGSLRELARATRAVAAVAAINERRVAEHQRTMAALADERAAIERTATDLEAQRIAAQQARAAAERAVSARADLIARIDSERDLTARYVGELQAAYTRLQQQIAADPGAAPGPPVVIPIGPFRGALEWPVAGPVMGRFGQTSGRLGGTAVRNGIEIAAPEETPVHAVHDGTVGYAEPFTGFGTLIILEHGGDNYSLYGYLGSAAVQAGDVVESGAELGRVGLAPAGPAALYFEVRIDGRSVDPLQWLKSVP